MRHMNYLERVLCVALLLIIVGCWHAAAADTAGEILPSYKQVEISTTDGTIYAVRFDDEGGLNSLHLTAIPGGTLWPGDDDEPPGGHSICFLYRRQGI